MARLLAFGAAASELLQVANANGGKISLLRNDTSIASGNEVGVITWYSADGNTQPVASIACFADGDHATDDKPGRLVFATTADGASSPTERMRIDSSGRLGLGNSAPLASLDVSGDIYGTLGIHFGNASGGTFFKSGTVENLSNSSRSLRIGADPGNVVRIVLSGLMLTDLKLRVLILQAA